MSGCGSLELCMASLVLLQKALEELHFYHKIIEEEKAGQQKTVEIIKADGQKVMVDILIRDAEGQTIGLIKKKDGTYETVFTASSGVSYHRQKEMVNRLKQRYAYLAVREKLLQEGYTIVEEKQGANQTIRLVARRWR